jgi:predicted transcriptional regulator
LDNDFVLRADDDLAHAIDLIKNFIGEAIPVVDDSNMFLGGLSEGQILTGAMDFQEDLKRNERN